MKKEILMTITGMSGSGKSTILDKLSKDYNYHKVITCTTRDPRPSENEVNGVDYHFLEKEDFKSQIKENKFVESEAFDGNYYGTRWSDLSANDNIPVAIVEPNGAKNMKKLFSDKNSAYQVINVFLECPEEVAIQRLTSRDSSIPERLAKRLNSIQTKERTWADYDYDLRIPLNTSIKDIDRLIKEKIEDVIKNNPTLKSSSKIKLK